MYIQRTKEPPVIVTLSPTAFPTLFEEGSIHC